MPAISIPAHPNFIAAHARTVAWSLPKVPGDLLLAVGTLCSRLRSQATVVAPCPPATCPELSSSVSSIDSLGFPEPDDLPRSSRKRSRDDWDSLPTRDRTADIAVWVKDVRVAGFNDLPEEDFGAYGFEPAKQHEDVPRYGAWADVAAARPSKKLKTAAAKEKEKPTTETQKIAMGTRTTRTRRAAARI